MNFSRSGLYPACFFCSYLLVRVNSGDFPLLPHGGVEKRMTFLFKPLKEVSSGLDFCFTSAERVGDLSCDFCFRLIAADQADKISGITGKMLAPVT